MAGDCGLVSSWWAGFPLHHVLGTVSLTQHSKKGVLLQCSEHRHPMKESLLILMDLLFCKLCCTQPTVSKGFKEAVVVVCVGGGEERKWWSWGCFEMGNSAGIQLGWSTVAEWLEEKIGTSQAVELLMDMFTTCAHVCSCACWLCMCVLCLVANTTAESVSDSPLDKTRIVCKVSNIPCGLGYPKWYSSIVKQCQLILSCYHLRNTPHVSCAYLVMQTRDHAQHVACTLMLYFSSIGLAR